MKKFCSLLLTCSMLLTASSGAMAAAKPKEMSRDSATYQFLDDPLQGETGVVSVTYDAMDYEGETPLNQKDHLRWRESMVTGNGEIALLESCNPLSDVMIFQNTKFNMPNNDRMDTPAVYQKLDELRQAMVKDPYAAETEGKAWKLIEAQAKKSWGIAEDEKWACGYDYSYHPGNQLRVDMEGRGETQNYKRWTNYEKAEIGVGFEDKAGVWLRRTFTSRADNVIITEYTQSSEGEKLDLTLSLDDISSIPRESGNTPDVRYKVLVPEDVSYIGQIVHYPVFENSFLNEGGYAGVTRVLTDGAKEKVALEPTDAKNIGEKAAIQITDAEKVVLITALDRSIDTLGNMEEFARADSYELVDKLCAQIAEVEDIYAEKNPDAPVDFSYDNALAAHTRIHTPLFNSVKLDLHGDESDRALTNEALLKKQRANKTTLCPAMVERAFNAGRYAAICASGYSTTRLGGIWTGVFNPNWQADYTTDANVNLQVSAANVGSMKTFGRGYIDFMLRIVDDFQYNAEQIYGMEDAIMASGRTDGENGFIYHFNAGNPFFSWNAGTDWQLLPIYEYWQCYGNEIIPVGEDVDVDSLAEVLNLDESDVDRVKAEGFNLEEDILWPLLCKHAHFWEQFVDPRYYMDAEGKTCYDSEHRELAEGERYMLLPTYSPENHPKKPNEDVVQINSTMDIAAARDGLDMAIAMAGVIGDTSEVKKWQDLKSKLPEYKYQKQGDLMEWSIDECENRENYGHRHFSHLYPVWPGYETEDNVNLKAGAELTMALKARDGQNSQQSHGWMHKGLGEARLKNGQGIIDSLKPGMTGKIYHSSMTTAHNVNGSSAYCTDTQIGMVGIVQEGLLFSRTGITTDGFETENDGNRNGEIELLPALPEDWDEGSITGLHARTQATVDSMEWSRANGEVRAEITSNTDQTITLKCGVAWKNVQINGKTPEFDKNGNVRLSLSEGETVTAMFSLSEVKDGYYVVQSGESALTAQDQNRAENGTVSTKTMEATLPDNALWTEFPSYVYDDGKLPSWKTPGKTAGYLNVSNKVYLFVRGNNWADEYGEMWSWGAGASLDPAGLSQLRLANAGGGYVYLETCQEWKGGDWDGASQKVLAIHPETDKVCNTVKNPEDDAQKWKRIVTKNGYVAFQNKANREYLSAEKMDSNGNIMTIPAQEDYGRHQVWKLVSQQGGGIRLINTGSGRALAAEDGALVQNVQGAVWKLSAEKDGYRILIDDGTKGISADGTLVSAEEASAFQFVEKDKPVTYYPIDAVTLNVPQDTFQIGESMRVSAEVEASGISNMDWISVGIAPVYLVENGTGAASIDKNGNLKALRVGDVTVIALCKADPSVRAEKTVRITSDQQVLTIQYGANAELSVEGAYEALIEKDGMFGAAVQAGEEIRLTFTPVNGPFAGATLNGAEIPFEADGFTYTFTMPKDKISLRFAFTTIHKDILETMLNKANEVTDEQLEKLVLSVRKKFIAARNKAQAVYEDSAATQDGVNKAWRELLNMMHYLSFEEGTKDKLAYWLDYAFMLDLEAFTPASREGYAEALAYAQEIYNDEGETLKAEVEKAVNQLYDAIMRLKYRANTETLEFFVKEAQEIDLDKYMDGPEKDRFSELLPQAEELLADGNATQEQVDKLAESLREAIEDLRLTPSREALKELLDESEALDPDDYTQESYAVLRTSLDDAWDMYYNEDAKPEEITAAIASVWKARNGLLPAEKPEEPMKPTRPSKPASGSSGNVSNAYGNAGTAVAVTGAAVQKSVRSDTTVNFTLKKGSAYCFKMTVLNGSVMTPSFTVGNGNVLKTQFVSRIGNEYYYRVWAVGAPGQSTGVYTAMPNEKPQQHCAITIV
ncbi:glycosyl hydrolase family 95 catalytic domain-containing protein [Anaeromassilibacillus senegalensis]|uniref:glycosyl hydrolase family 95 catalytic domain-containing protein n=1 Tax=Anaeromassilibacillus senegalensis TaxID=1673717 RepID=UPI0018A83360|nr:glycoside hydrolase N-terminal domain-containing protein [Anaeromassilibacillus senegalensis]